jgi:hypothetical protein
LLLSVLLFVVFYSVFIFFAIRVAFQLWYRVL